MIPNLPRARMSISYLRQHLATQLVFFLIVLTLNQMSVAHTRAEVEVNCPLCHTHFKSTIALSGSIFGIRLDHKPVGPIYAPEPIPSCPQCHFILFNRQISAEELEQCRGVVHSEQYRQCYQRASYYRLGTLFERIGRDDLTMAHVFLQASWQEEGQPKVYHEDVTKSLYYLSRCVEGIPDTNDMWLECRMLQGELLRRIGQFEAAKSVWISLRDREIRQTVDNKRIIAYQLYLSQAKDDRAHTAAEATKHERFAKLHANLRKKETRTKFLIGLLCIPVISALLSLRKVKRIPYTHPHRRLVKNSNWWLSFIRANRFIIVLNSINVGLVVLLVTFLIVNVNKNYVGKKISLIEANDASCTPIQTVHPEIRYIVEVLVSDRTEPQPHSLKYRISCYDENGILPAPRGEGYPPPTQEIDVHLVPSETFPGLSIYRSDPNHAIIPTFHDIPSYAGPNDVYMQLSSEGEVKCKRVSSL